MFIASAPGLISHISRKHSFMYIYCTPFHHKRDMAKLWPVDQSHQNANTAALVIRGLFIHDFAYLRSRKIHQNSLFAVFPALIHDYLEKFGLKIV